MSRSIRIISLLVFFLSGVFIVFFFVSKQNPFFSNINPFAEDPYDAVGSFTIQLSFFASSLCLMRAFRSYDNCKSIANQNILLFRGLIISIVSVLITLFTDMIAIARYYSTWSNLFAGQLLALLIFGMILLTLFTLWFVIRHSDKKFVMLSHSKKIISVSFLIYVLIFVVYPSGWRQNIFGEICTVALALVLSFLLIWLIVNSLFPISPNTYFEDSMDDISAVVLWITKHIKISKFLFSPFLKLSNLSVFRLFINWLNPRLHRWNFAILIASLMAIYLTLVQTIGEGIKPGSSNFMLIVVIFLSFESGAILFGYRLFADYLGIFRKDPS